MGVLDDETGIGLQLIVFGWCHTSGPGYKNGRDRYHAEREVTALEGGVEVHGMTDATILDLLRHERLNVNGRAGMPPYKWALAGWLQWHTLTGEDPY